jgi:tetratricopeptide (TPR) repeat protein
MEVAMHMNRNIHRATLDSRGAGVFLFGVLLAAGTALFAGEAPLWGSLEQGPHAVGFMAMETYDYSRTFQPKRDYFGTILPGERARPIQACAWYPSLEVPDAPPVLFGDYAFTPPEDQRFYDFLAAIQNREIGFLHRVFRNNQTAVLEALGTDMKAVKNADPAGGRFPLLVYHSDFNNGIAENAVLCEYLASHGFVVALTHSFGAAAVGSEPSAAGLETMVGDMEFVIGALRDLGFIDTDKLGVFGYRAGGLAALLLQMRNYNVDAVVGLEAVVTDPEWADVVTGNPYYDIARMTAPLLDIHAAGGEDENDIPLETFKYAPRYSLEFAEAIGFAFTTYGLLPAMFMPAGTPELTPTGDTYEAVCGYALNFFNAYLNGSKESLAFLERSPSENGMGQVQITMSRMEAQDRPPTQDEFMGILADGDVETAVELHEKFTAADPELVLFAEATMNITGYRFLQQGRVSEAIALFKMNAETYPRSANCWDSLAEAYIANGDNDNARECVERVLETLPNDTAISDDLRQALEANAERYIEMLKEEEADSE